MELHAPQIQGFYPEELPVDNLYAFPEVVRYLRSNHHNFLDNLVIVSPDLGAAQRTKSFLVRLEKAQKDEAKKQKYSFAICNKERSKAGQIEEIKVIGNVKGKNAFVPDDIIDSGGTLCSLAKILRKKGVKKLFCYGTHGIFSKGAEEICSCYDLVMTSNTHNKNYKNVETIDLSPLFAEAIYRAEKGLSISKLFE